MKARDNESKTYYAALTKNGSVNYEKSEALQVLSGDRIIFDLRDTSVLGTNVYMRINLPFEKDAKLVYPSNIPSETYNESTYETIAKIEAKSSPTGGVFFEIPLEYSGSFFFQLEYLDSETVKLTKADWILVHPKDTPPAESMVLLSVLTRCLGKLKRWAEVLIPQVKLGYNAIHFMPVQTYGESGSMYSLRNHHTVDDWYFDDTTLPPEERLDMLKATIEKLNSEHKVKCLVDIIPNHVSPACAWLREHPEAAYNLHNSPHFRVAWEYEKLLQKFSSDFVDKKFPECPSAPFIRNENDLQAVLKVLERQIKQSSLGDYFKYNIKSIKEKFEQKMKEVSETKVKESDIADYLKVHSKGYGIAPFGVDVDIEDLEEVPWSVFEKCLDKEEALWQAKYEGFMKESLVNIATAVRVEKFAKNLLEIRKDCPIVYPYFTEYEPLDTERDPFEYVLAHNGWTEVTENFVGKDTFHYLRRKVGIWNCIKLYYGKEPSDSSFIWEYMEKYITTMAGIFQGFRIDNCHSTPTHVLSYLLRQARAVNPNLFVYAELYAGGAESEMAYVKIAGLNALMRELSYVNDAGGLSHAISWDGIIKDKPLEFIEFEKGQKLPLLKSTRPKALLYDITHDNPAPIERWNPQAILPLVCAAAMSQVSIGSTLGVDFFVPYNLSVVYERRLYEAVCGEGLVDFSELVKDDKSRVKSEEEEKNPVEIIYEGEASKVAVLGGFNDWKKDANVMEKTGVNAWKTTLLLSPGKHPYKFLVNDTDWVLGPGETLKDSSGHVNNVLIVKGEELPEAKIFEDICPIRKIMNELHKILGIEKAAIDIRPSDDMVIIKRFVGKKCYILIARTHFVKGQVYVEENISKTVDLPGKLTHVLFTANLYVDIAEVKRFASDSKIINGVKGKLFFHQGEAGLKHFAHLRRGAKNDSLQFFKIPCSLCVLLATEQLI